VTALVLKSRQAIIKLPVLLAILGPTASGKTTLGLEVAQALGAEIISADSMQIYRGMDIGTAKPSRAERALVPHHLIDILNPDQPYNVGQFVTLARSAFAELELKKKPALVLGGTHLYIKTLTAGLPPAPAAPPELKADLYQRLTQTGVAPLYEELKRLDPQVAERLHPNDQARVTRALEVFLAFGRSIDSYPRCAPAYRTFFIGIEWPREELYQRINQRAIEMVESGLVAETESLLNAGYKPELPAMGAIGYKQAVEYLKGQISKEQMIVELQTQTRRYAKKQLTWCKSLENIHWVPPGPLQPELLTQIQKFYE